MAFPHTRECMGLFVPIVSLPIPRSLVLKPVSPLTTPSCPLYCYPLDSDHEQTDQLGSNTGATHGHQPPTNSCTCTRHPDTHPPNMFFFFAMPIKKSITLHVYRLFPHVRRPQQFSLFVCFPLRSVAHGHSHSSHTPSSQSKPPNCFVRVNYL